MGTFPTKESDVMVLAQELKTGLTANPVVYPDPPVATLDLQTLMTALTTAQNAMVAAKAAAEASSKAKIDALEAVVEAMKKDIRYAENTVNGDNEKLMLLGWSGRKEKTPLAAPGQTMMLLAVGQGEGWVNLEWQAPVDGGKVAAYKVQRRRRPEGTWEDVATALETHSMLNNQPRATEWEFRIVAANKAGEGLPSNTVLAVL